MGSAKRHRSRKSERVRLAQRRLARLEITAPEAGRDLLPAAMKTAMAGEPPRPGGILAALRRSPLVGANIELSRPREEGRKVHL